MRVRSYMSVRVTTAHVPTLLPQGHEGRRSFRSVIACGPPQVGHRPDDPNGAIELMLPSGPMEGAKLYVSLDPNNPTRLTGDQITPFKLSPKYSGNLVPSQSNVAPNYLFDARYVALDHYTLAAIPRSRASDRDNRSRHASRPMEAVRPQNVLLTRPTPVTQASTVAPPTHDPTLFASGHMDTADGLAAHIAVLYPHTESGKSVNTPRLATLTYDHPSTDKADWAIHFDAKIDGQTIRVTADVGRDLAEFRKIESDINSNARARSVFWRMFFAVYNQLDSTYAVESAQKDVLTAVLDSYK